MKIKFLRNFKPTPLSARAKKLIIRWIENLESGKYKQTARSLCKLTDDGGSYCCLGVLGRTLGIHPQNLIYTGFLTGVSSNKINRLRNMGIFNDKLSLDINCLAREGELQDEDEFIGINKLNDTYNLTFKQIARVLRKQFGLEKEKI